MIQDQDHGTRKRKNRKRSSKRLKNKSVCRKDKLGKAQCK